jgi:hypothetical protein
MQDSITIKYAYAGGFRSTQGGNPNTGSWNWTPNRNRNVPLVRTQWNTVEFYGKINVNGANDGIYRLWVNGLLVLELTDVFYCSNNCGFGEHDVIVYHGGQGHPIPTASYIDADYFYVSGR